MAGLGRAHEIWAYPFHYYIALRTEYLKIVGLTVTDGTPADLEEIAPGVTMESWDTREKLSRTYE